MTLGVAFLLPGILVVARSIAFACGADKFSEAFLAANRDEDPAFPEAEAEQRRQRAAIMRFIVSTYLY